MTQGHRAVGDETSFSPYQESCLQAMQRFLEAFRNLDWEMFCQSFAEDATFFFPPTARAPRRANNKSEIEAIFQRVFENARRQKEHPPYLTIEPKDMRLQMLQNAALVTFHLEDPDVFGRRTVVLENRGGRWLIVHLHASNLVETEMHR